ncbi:hypothetical protein COLSTE_01411 [Collinsella stercoris DSM 13279]|uniref:Uncharacterized protein n=1 Tax=Collinsella stercoris DSM 13279 TaxID=445975 RepID=B6GBF3_9ACTN|nr:hypothetical protein COLSTE_01411 [Collinsella stercoris DSM 13279]
MAQACQANPHLAPCSQSLDISPCIHHVIHPSIPLFIYLVIRKNDPTKGDGHGT